MPKVSLQCRGDAAPGPVDPPGLVDSSAGLLPQKLDFSCSKTELSRLGIPCGVPGTLNTIHQLSAREVLL